MAFHLLTGGCEFHCSVMGCDPFLWLVKGKPSNLAGFLPLPSYIGCLPTLYRRCGIEFTAPTFRTAIRHAAFCALGLTRTCCGTDPDSKCAYKDPHIGFDKSKVRTINEEQTSLPTFHAELVSEFQEKASESIGEGSDGGSPFPSLWGEYRPVRVEEELEKLDGDRLTGEKRRGAESIGARWCEPPEDERRDANPYRRKTLERWFFKLDAICPELDEPWPEGSRRVHELS